MRSTSGRSGTVPCALGLAAAVAVCAAGTAHAQYVRTDLVADEAGKAAFTDPNLLNPWGIAFNPAGYSWVANNHSGTGTLYDGVGTPQPLVVSIPSPTESFGGSATGIAYYGGSGFRIGGGEPSQFLFASEDGVISGWNSSMGTQAARAVITSAVYKGLAVSSDKDRLFAADFVGGKIDSYDSNFSPIFSGGFQDPGLPSGYSPFNVAVDGDKVYVAYALIDPTTGDEVAFPGFGYVSEFSTDGAFTKRIASEGVLNAPWGLVVAPSDFGAFSGDLLVGNFGDGTINAFDPATGEFKGTLTDAGGKPIAIDGLWGIEFGNDMFGQPHNALFYAAGPDGEEHGLYGRIDIPAPGVWSLMGVGAALAGSRRRRA